MLPHRARLGIATLIVATIALSGCAASSTPAPTPPASSASQPAAELPLTGARPALTRPATAKLSAPVVKTATKKTVTKGKKTSITPSYTTPEGVKVLSATVTVKTTKGKTVGSGKKVSVKAGTYKATTKVTYGPAEGTGFKASTTSKTSTVKVETKSAITAGKPKSVTVNYGKSHTIKPVYTTVGAVSSVKPRLTVKTSKGKTVAQSKTSATLKPGTYTVYTTVTYKAKNHGKWTSATSKSTTKVTIKQKPKPKAKQTWFQEMRGRLDKVGGKHIPLIEYDGRCGGVRAAACSSFNGTIMVAKSIMNEPPARRDWAMKHELAHQYQIKIWDKLQASKTYKSLYGSNIELLANCMASQQGYTNHGMNSMCTKSRKDFAAKVWKGRVS